MLPTAKEGLMSHTVDQKMVRSWPRITKYYAKGVRNRRPRNVRASSRRESESPI